MTHWPSVCAFLAVARWHHQAVRPRPSVPQTAVKDLSLALFSHHLLFLALPSKNQLLLIPSSILLIELIHTSRGHPHLVNRLGSFFCESLLHLPFFGRES